MVAQPQQRRQTSLPPPQPPSSRTSPVTLGTLHFRWLNVNFISSLLWSHKLSLVCVGGLNIQTHTHIYIMYTCITHTWRPSSQGRLQRLPGTVSAAALAASSSSPRQQLHLIVSKICENFFQPYRKLFKRLKWVYPNPPLHSSTLLQRIPAHSTNFSKHVSDMLFSCDSPLSGAAVCTVWLCVCVCVRTARPYIYVGCMCVCACMYVCACVECLFSSVALPNAWWFSSLWFLYLHFVNAYDNIS